LPPPPRSPLFPYTTLFRSYAFGDNPHTLLAVSDLVFLDAVGTGFSRLAGDSRPDEVWGVDQDVEVFARAILRYLTMTGRSRCRPDRKSTRLNSSHVAISYA